MLFNSIEFLFVFLPLVLLGFTILQRARHQRAAIVWLTLSSLFFYGWWNPAYVPLLLLSMGVNYSLGRQLSGGRKGSASYLLAAGICFNLGLLAYFKYFNFFIDSINAIAGSDFNFEKIILPLAISFYTFQQITYLVDSRRGLTASHSLLDYSLFVTFFPQLIAGPIVHHSEMLSQFSQLRYSATALRNLSIGVSIFAIGLFKKVVLADNLALVVNPVYSLSASGEVLHSLDALSGILAYALQLYFDFSGYSDMAIGLAAMFGIRLPVNFRSPYKATSIIEFWRRWHITLSRFLRDYLYIPLGGNRLGAWRRQTNLLLTMLLGGLWHGANWTFIAWGVAHGLLLVVNHGWRWVRNKPSGESYRGLFPARFAAQTLTLACVVLAWVLFRSESLPAATTLFIQMLDWNSLSLAEPLQKAILSTDLYRIARIVSPHVTAAQVICALLSTGWLICLLLPNSRELFARQLQKILVRPEEEAPSGWLTWKPNLAWAVLTTALLLSSFLYLSEPSEFLYFQF